LWLVNLTTALVTHLRNNMPNPHGSGNWIYSDYPRMDATFPRISVTQTGAILSPAGIGDKISPITESGSTFSLAKVAMIDYDIDVWVKMNDKATFDSTTYVGTKLRDFLAEKVIRVLEAGKETLKNSHGILDIEEIGMFSHPLDEDNLLHRKTITIRITVLWPRE